MGNELRMRGAFKFFATLMSLSGTLWAQTSVITLPAAASIVGLAPFFSDVRAFEVVRG